MRVGIMHQSGSLPHSYNVDTQSLYAMTGNTGNQAFRYAVSSHIQHSGEFISWRESPELVREKYDIIVFAAANLMNPETDSGQRAKFLEAVGLPVVVVGLGAQAKSEEDHVHLTPGTQYFLSVISHLSETIGVRGPFSAEVLAREGIHNVEVTGCPSNLINLDPDLGFKIKRRIRRCDKIQKLAVNITIAKTHQILNRPFFPWTLGRKATFVTQSPESLVKLIRRQGSNRKTSEAILRTIQYSLAPGVSLDYIERELLPNFTTMFDIPAWMEFMQEIDLSVGTRLHGNMLAIQSGTPAIFFPFDTRTRETAELMKLPRVNMNKVGIESALEEVVQSVKFNPEEYTKTRVELAQKYAAIYDRVGIELSDRFKAFLGRETARDSQTFSGENAAKAVENSVEAKQVETTTV